MSGAPVIIAINGKSTVPIGSACTRGFNDTRPWSRAVGSPRRSAVHAWAISCTVSENNRTVNWMKIWAALMSSTVRACSAGSALTVVRLRPAREKRKDGIGDLLAHHRRQLLTRRAPHTREAAERRQQRLATARANPGHVVELRSQIADGPRAAVERDRESMRLVSDALN